MVFLNGRILPIEDAKVSVLDRGFIFGDGVYELVPVYSRVPFRLEEHLLRLERSLAGLRIRNPYSPAQWREFIYRLIDAQPFDDQGVYFQVTRGVAKRDHAFPKNAEPTVFMMSNPLVNPPREQVEKGAIGKLVAYYATYYTNPVKPMPPASSRPAGMSDVEWQIRNWYNFTWLCGDSLVEQAVHSADKIAWAMGDAPPVSCVGVGGRAIPSEGGNIYDHFEINYIYPNGVRAFLASRQIEGCHNENSDYILGSDGLCTIGRGPKPRIEGKNNWSFNGTQYNMYQREHDLLFASIRRNQPMNDGKRMATSTLLAMMGRMAAYTGQEVTWEQALNSQEKLFPEKLDWNGSLEVRPLAEPGITKFV